MNIGLQRVLARQLAGKRCVPRLAGHRPQKVLFDIEPKFNNICIPTRLNLTMLRNRVKFYPIDTSNFQRVYGIQGNPQTKILLPTPGFEKASAVAESQRNDRLPLLISKTAAALAL